MTHNLELFVNGTADTVGQLDLYGDEVISLNISIQDITDIQKRNSTFSQSFTIPASKNNNVLLNHIFNIGADSTFDPSKKTPCYMTIDSLPVFSGSFQLIKIRVNNTNVEAYDCVVYGEIADLVKSLGTSLLTDLDFSELNHNRDADHVVDSWYADTKELGYYYPIIDYGYDLDISELNSGVLSISVSTGNVVTATATTITDTNQTWATNGFTFPNYQVTIVSGAGAGQTRTILSNTGVQLTISGAPFSPIPDVTSVYSVNKIDATNPYNSNGNGLAPSIFKPALSNTYVFKKIIENAGFIVDGTFIDSDIFSQTIMPFTGPDIGLNQQDIKTFRAYMPPGFTSHPNNIGSNINYPFDIDYGKGYDVLGTYNAATHDYTNPTANSIQQFFVDLSYKYNVNAFVSGELSFDLVYVNFFRSSLPTGIGGQPGWWASEQATTEKCPGYNFSIGSIPPNGTYMPPKFLTIQSPKLNPAHSMGSSFDYPAQPGETFWCRIGFANSNVIYQVFDDNCAFYNRVYTNGVIDNFIIMNDYVPKNVKQIDYIKSCITMFNLMVIPSKLDPKRLTFIPRNDYFAAGTVKDWTLKVDHSQKIEETLISEQQNSTIQLTYKADKDYYNTNYTDKTGFIYGEYNREIDNEWVDGTKKIEVLFSPTPVDKVFGSTDIFLPKIAKREENTGLYGRTDFNIRFLRKNRYPLLSANTLRVLGKPASNVYPYCGHLDHPTASTIDYNFGPIEFAYYPELTTLTSNNLHTLFWKDTLDDISDKNSKLIKLKIQLSPNDIATFNYNDIIFIDKLTDDGGHYFTVNKINYTVTDNIPSTVELIKINKKPTPLAQPTVYGAAQGGPIAAQLGPISGLNLGDNPPIKSGPTVLVGDNNSTGTNTAQSFVVGNNNTIQDNARQSILIGINDFVATEPNTIIVGGVRFLPGGRFITLCNDIDSGEDIVLNPFSVAPYNDIDSAEDAVLGIGGVSQRNDIDSLEDQVF